MRLLHDHIAGRKGVHLTTLLAALPQGDNGWTVPALRRQYEQYGIPVRSQLNLGGVNRPGIHRDDLTSVKVASAPTSPGTTGTPPVLAKRA